MQAVSNSLEVSNLLLRVKKLVTRRMGWLAILVVSGLADLILHIETPVMRADLGAENSPLLAELDHQCFAIPLPVTCTTCNQSFLTCRVLSRDNVCESTQRCAAGRQALPEVNL